MAFTDNEGVFGSFVKGHSDNSSRAPLIEFFARCEESLETISWIDRVPSLYCCPIQQTICPGAKSSMVHLEPTSSSSFLRVRFREFLGEWGTRVQGVAGCAALTWDVQIVVLLSKPSDAPCHLRGKQVSDPCVCVRAAIFHICFNEDVKIGYILK